jgi:hypothetical protein
MPTNHIQPSPEEVGRLLVRAYPDVLTSSDVDNIYWLDGAAMPIVPDLLEQFASVYPLGPEYVFGERQRADPGRVRSMSFFQNPEER